MKKSATTRQILTVATVVDIFAILVLLGLPQITDKAGLPILTILLSLTPLLILAALMSYIFGKSYKDNPTQPRVKNFERIAAGGILACSGLSLLFTRLSAHTSLIHDPNSKFAYEDVGTGLLVTCFILAVALINTQNFIYWPLWSRYDRQNADERQLYVRKRVFERAYRYLIATLFIGGLMIEKNQNHESQILLGIIVLLVLSLPAIVAAWQKDS